MKCRLHIKQEMRPQCDNTRRDKAIPRRDDIILATT